MTESLLAISIGPVQPFIAAARKTRDFWCGSVLLSQVARAVARSLQEQDATLIFPAPSLLENRGNIVHERDGAVRPIDADVANKVLARIPGDPTNAAKRAERAGRDRLREVARDAFRRTPQLDEELAFQQLDALLEVFWAAVSVPPGNYKQARVLAERLLAARKNTRDFSQLTLDEERGRRPKCAIDGQREAVASVPTGDRGQKEPLCGVCVLKRYGFGEQSWSDATTSHFAAKPALQRIEMHSEQRDRFLGTLTTLRGIETSLEPDYLFEGRLATIFDGDQVRKAQSALNFLLRETGVRVSPYYALLRADGDRMGKAIDACDLEEHHQQLSASLVEFTRQANRIVETEHGGRVVYAGGDDVLAFLPISGSIACARKLADTFVGLVGQPIASIARCEVPTLSVGLVIAHHLTPLSDVIELSQRAEKVAKRQRNALAVLVAKRSGGETVAAGPWHDFDELLSELIDVFKNDILPAGLPYELRAIGRRTMDLRDTGRAVESAELKRVLDRKLAGVGKRDGMPAAIVRRLTTQLEKGGLFELAAVLGIAREVAAIANGGA